MKKIMIIDGGPRKIFNTAFEAGKEMAEKILA